MKTKTIIILFFLLLINPICTYAQDDQNSKSNIGKKLQSGLYELLRLAEVADTSAEANQKFKDILRIDKSLKADSKDRVRVMVHFKSIYEIIKYLQSSDGVVEETYPNYPYVLCKIHPKKLRALASISSVLTIQRNVEGKTRIINR